MTTENDQRRSKRWSAPMLRMAADVAKQKGVTVRLEPDGAITVMPAPGPSDDDYEEDSGLEKW
jgi:hypothetical protein